MREGKKIKRWVKAKKRSTTSPKRMDGFKFGIGRKKGRKKNIPPYEVALPGTRSEPPPGYHDIKKSEPIYAEIEDIKKSEPIYEEITSIVYKHPKNVYVSTITRPRKPSDPREFRDEKIVYIGTPERTPERTPIYSTPNRLERSPKYVYDYPKINGKRIVQETMLARNPKKSKKSKKSRNPKRN